MYYGNNTQVATYSQISNLQSQIAQLLSGNRIMFVQRSGTATVNNSINYTWNTNNPLRQQSSITIYNFSSNGYTPIYYVLYILPGTASVTCNTSDRRYDRYNAYINGVGGYSTSVSYQSLFQNDISPDVGETLTTNTCNGYLISFNMNSSLYTTLNYANVQQSAQAYIYTSFTSRTLNPITLNAYWEHGASYSSGTINASMTVSMQYYLSALCVIN